MDDLNDRLVRAVSIRDIETVNSLLNAGVDLGRSPGVTGAFSLPLGAAIHLKNYEAMRALLDAGASPHAVVEYGNMKWSLLAMCFWEDNLVAAQALLDAGADPWFMENDASPTVLQLMNRSINGVSLLQELYQRNVDLCAPFGATNTTLLHEACFFESEEKAIFLISIGADPLAKDTFGITAVNRSKDSELREKLTTMHAALLVKQEIDSVAKRVADVRSL